MDKDEHKLVSDIKRSYMSCQLIHTFYEPVLREKIDAPQIKITLHNTPLNQSGFFCWRGGGGCIAM